MISIRSLSRRFGPVTAVDRLDLDLQPREILALLGPNGAGKTTLIRMICGLLKADSGRISFPERPQGERPRIGYCPQENIFYPRLSCQEQLIFIAQMHGMGFREARHKALSLLEKLGLSAKRNSLAATLSGGMQRRLNLAYALIHEPDVLILDEPEAGLDPQSRLLVRTFIQQLGRDRTILLSTHNMDEAERLADRIAVMDHGRIIALGSAAELKQTRAAEDVLELILDSAVQGTDNRVFPSPDHPFFSDSALQDLELTVLAGALLLKGEDMAGRLPALRKAAAAHALPVLEFRLRHSSLEDVFFQLTGRQLR